MTQSGVVNWFSGLSGWFCGGDENEGTSRDQHSYNYEAPLLQGSRVRYDEDDWETESRGWRCSGRKIAIVIVVILAVGAAVGGTVAGVGPEKVGAFFNKPMTVLQGVTRIALPVMGGLLLIGLVYYTRSAIAKELKAVINALSTAGSVIQKSRAEEKEKHKQQQVDKHRGTDGSESEDVPDSSDDDIRSCDDDYSHFSNSVVHKHEVRSGIYGNKDPQDMVADNRE